MEQFYQVVADRREKKQLRDLQFLISDNGTLSDPHIEQINAIYKWTQMFSDLDQLVCEDLLQQNPAKDIQADFVLQRILDDKTIVDGEQWKDSSECMICKQHNHIHIEMDN